MGITIDVGHDIPIFSEVCTFCKNLNIKKLRSCKAYPKKEGIPMIIWGGKNNHKKPYKGDNGIQFEPVEEAKAKSDIQKSVETLRDELQIVFPDNRVVIEKEV